MNNETGEGVMSSGRGAGHDGVENDPRSRPDAQPNRGAQPVSIVGYRDLDASALAAARSRIDRIFFEASSVQSFKDDAHREAFRWLWLGRYLATEPSEAFVAICEGHVCGYLAGSLEDPAPRAEFRELAYFQTFQRETARFPAHLHINVGTAMRGLGIGGRLIAAFEAHAHARQCPGLHVVTGALMRNVRFYERLGFREVARAPRNGAEVVMLAKEIG